MTDLAARVPEHHWDFLTNLTVRHEDPKHIYVHAGLDPRHPVDQQTEESILWVRDIFLDSQRNFGKLVVHGHTVALHGPELRHNRLNLDTGAVYGNTLTGAIIDPETWDPVLLLSTDEDRPTISVEELKMRSR